MTFGFSEQNQDGYLDSADESVYTVPCASNSSGVEAVEDELDPWGQSAGNQSPGDDGVGDDSGVVASNTGREIVLMCLKCTKIYNAHAQLLFFLFNFLFGDILMTIAVVVCIGAKVLSPYRRRARIVQYLARLF